MRISVILILSLLSFGISAQLNISFKVLNQETNTPVQGASIHIVNNSTYTTDSNGEVFVKVPSQGAYKVFVFKEEFEWYEKDFTLEEGGQYICGITTLSKELNAVEIIAKRQKSQFIEQLRPVEGTSIYAGKKSEVVYLDLLIANKAINNARQIYSKVVGLNIYEGNEGGLQLNLGGRGLDPNRSSNFNTRQNGYDISADVLGYPESYYTPPSEAIESIQVVRGAASLQYGTQFGGLVNFKLIQPNFDKKWHFTTKQTIGSFGLFNSFNSIGYTTEKWGVYGFYNGKIGNGYRPNSNFQAHTAYLSNVFKITPRTKLKFDLTYMDYLMRQPGGLTDSQFIKDPKYSNRDRNWFHVNWNLASMRLDQEITDKSKFSIQLWGLLASRSALGYRGNVYDLNSNAITDLDEQGTDGEYVSPRDFIQGKFRNYGAEVKHLYKYSMFNSPQIWLVGAKYYQARNRSRQGAGSADRDADFTFYNKRFPDYPHQSEFEFPNQNVALFSEHIFNINQRFSITPGIRWEYIRTKSVGKYQSLLYDIAGNVISKEEINESKNLPRSFFLMGIGGNYKWSTTTKLYFNLSQNYRSVTFSDIRVVNPSFIVDENIKDESGYTSDIGIKGRIGRVYYDVNVFGILYKDRIGIILDNRANRIRKNIGTAGIIGLENLFELELIKNRGTFSLSTFLNSAITYSQYLSSEQNNVVGNSVEFIPLVNLKSGIQFGYKNFLSSLQFTYLSKQFTDVENSEASLPGEQSEGLVGSIPAYSIFDFSISYKLNRFTFEGGINNFLNNQYFTRRATGYPGPGIIPSDPRTFYLSVGYNFHKNN